MELLINISKILNNNFFEDILKETNLNIKTTHDINIRIQDCPEEKIKIFEEFLDKMKQM